MYIMCYIYISISLSLYIYIYVYIYIYYCFQPFMHCKREETAHVVLVSHMRVVGVRFEGIRVLCVYVCVCLSLSLSLLSSLFSSLSLFSLSLSSLFISFSIPLSFDLSVNGREVQKARADHCRRAKVNNIIYIIYYCTIYNIYTNVLLYCILYTMYIVYIDVSHVRLVWKGLDSAVP